MSIKLMTAVWDSGALRGTELIVMLALADHANDDGECWPSISRLAQRARIKERAVQYALSSLEAQGQISRDVTGGKGRTSRYLLYPKGAENCTPAEAPKGAENCTPKVAKGCKATTQRVQQLLHPNL